jgi:AraC-like DNA-binding protein
MTLRGHLMVTREPLEQKQILIYAVTLIIAAAVGLMWPTFTEPLGHTISFVIAILLFSMFTQIPFLRLKETLAVDRSYLTQCFKQVYGVSPKSYLIQIRIRETKRLLESTDLTIDEIAERLCFSSSSHLNRSFQNILGMTPSEFRNHFQKRVIMEEV